MQIDKLIEKLEVELSERKLLAIFDRDGTLVSYHPDPAAALVKAEILTLLLKLNSLPETKVAILSARDLRQLKVDFGENHLVLAGNYGLEIYVPNSTTFTLPTAQQARAKLSQAKAEMEKLLTEETKVILEDHQLVLCLHWHLTPRKYLDKVHEVLKYLEHKYKELSFKALPTSYEVWPDLQWNKSNGLDQIITMLNLKLGDYLVLYIGDSEADEPAFGWVNDHGGISVRIGKNTNSLAQFRIDLPLDMERVLKKLITMGRRIC